MSTSELHVLTREAHNEASFKKTECSLLVPEDTDIGNKAQQRGEKENPCLQVRVPYNPRSCCAEWHFGAIGPFADYICDVLHEVMILTSVVDFLEERGEQYLYQYFCLEIIFINNIALM